jgi:hypothetical protein
MPDRQPPFSPDVTRDGRVIVPAHAPVLDPHAALDLAARLQSAAHRGLAVRRAAAMDALANARSA